MKELETELGFPVFFDSKEIMKGENSPKFYYKEEALRHYRLTKGNPVSINYSWSLTEFALAEDMKNIKRFNNSLTDEFLEQVSRTSFIFAFIFGFIFLGTIAGLFFWLNNYYSLEDASYFSVYVYSLLLGIGFLYLFAASLIVGVKYPLKEGYNSFYLLIEPFYVIDVCVRLYKSNVKTYGTGITDKDISRVHLIHKFALEGEEPDQKE